MITIYNEAHDKNRKDDHVIRSMIEDYFEQHQYLEFTNILVWIKESNPDSSAGPALFDCSIEARLPAQEPVYVSKKNKIILNGVREALETLKEEILRKRKKMQDRSHSSSPRPF